jgi:hypothetical protein
MKSDPEVVSKIPPQWPPPFSRLPLFALLLLLVEAFFVISVSGRLAGYSRLPPGLKGAGSSSIQTSEQTSIEKDLSGQRALSLFNPSLTMQHIHWSDASLE